MTQKEDTYDQELRNHSELPLAWVREYTEVKLPNSDQILAAYNIRNARIKIVGVKHEKVFGGQTYFIIQYLS